MTDVAPALSAPDDDLVRRAAAYLEAGRPIDAQRLAGQRLAFQPDDVGGLLILTEAARQQGRHAEALSSIEQAVALAPSEDQAWRLMAAVKIAVLALEGAAEAAERAVELDPTEWRNHLLKSAAARLTNRPEALKAAAESARLTVQLAPQEPAAHCELGDVLLALKRRGAAAAAFRSALQLDHTNANARAGLAATDLSQWRPLSASDEYAGLLKEDPLDEVARRNLILAVAEAARVAGLVATAAIAISLRLAQEASHRRGPGESGTPYAASMGVVAVASVVFVVLLIRILRRGRAQVTALFTHHPWLVAWLSLTPICLVTIAAMLWLGLPIGVISWTSIPLFVICVTPGLIGLDRAKRLLARLDAGILAVDAAGLDGEDQRQRELAQLDHEIETRTRARRRVLLILAGCPVAFLALEAIAQTQVDDYAANRRWLLLVLGLIICGVIGTIAAILARQLARRKRRRIELARS